MYDKSFTSPNDLKEDGEDALGRRGDKGMVDVCTASST
jgi:hypothetical protein